VPVRVITQNVDGLHQRAGMPGRKVLELHGTTQEVVCTGCGARTPTPDVLPRLAAGEPDPPCLDCGGILKTATVMFGQELDPLVLGQAAAIARACEVMIAVGTSLQVYPAAGLVDLAVNVHPGPRPGWLDRALHASLDEVAAYPDARHAARALALRHGVDPEWVLPTAGGAEAFTLVARMRAWRHPVVVHPQFTEPEAALVAAGRVVGRHLLKRDDGFRLDPRAFSRTGQHAGADLVVVGNPTNPTGVLHRAADLRAMRRPGRVLVVDEAFMDAVPGEPESLIGPDLEGLLVIRSPLGLYAEEFDASTGRHLGNFPQAFSHLALIEAAARIITHDLVEEY